MLAEDLAELEQALPELFDRRRQSGVPDDLVYVSDDNVVIAYEGSFYVAGIWNEVEASLLSDEETDDMYHVSRAGDLYSMSDHQVASICYDIEHGPITERFRNYEEILRIYARLGGASGLHGTENASPNPPQVGPDILALYRPWHYYAEPEYGIYLIHEAVIDLSRIVGAACKGLLSPVDSVKVAKALLFHHEQYHNKVEAFATRLEVSHRVPCYKAGFEAIWQADLAGGSPEEEGLATAYAAEVIRTSLFKADKGGSAKRRVATAVVIWLIRTFFNPRCMLALNLIGKPAAFEKAEEAFQERNAVRSLSLKLLPPSAWNAFGYSMAPSISRNKSFSYVISRSAPAVRSALNVRHLSAVVRRSDLVSTLTYILRGTIERRGKEPIFFAASGASAPIPAHRWVKEGTADSVVKMLGLPMKAREVLRLSKAEQRELRNKYSAA